MSRHDLIEGNARLTIGWDPPLATFFLQVWTGEDTDEDEGPSIWLGTTYAEARAPDPLMVIARGHIVGLPETLRRQLTVDQLKAPARAPSSFR